MLKTLVGYIMLVVGVLLVIGNVPSKAHAIGAIIILVTVDRILVGIRNSEVSTSEARV